MTNLCKYKNIFGEPGKDLHSIRFLDLAIIDVLATILSALFIHHFIIEKMFKIYTVSIWLVIFLCFLAGIIAHRLFCVRTTIDKLLFG
jgi:hypothetical protein